MVFAGTWHEGQLMKDLLEWLKAVVAGYVTAVAVVAAGYGTAATLGPRIGWPTYFTAYAALLAAVHLHRAIRPYGSVRRYVWSWRYAWRVYRDRYPRGTRRDWLTDARKHNARTAARFARQRLRRDFAGVRYPLLPGARPR
jgi:hypothetical protein